MVSQEIKGLFTRVRGQGSFADTDGEDRVEESMLLPCVPISKIMTRHALCVRPDMSIDALIALFVATGLRAVPVVGEDGTLMGMVSEADAILDAQIHSAECGSSVSTSLGAFTTALKRASDAESKRASDAESIMTPLPIALPENTPLSRAAAIMVFEQAARVAVTSSEGKIVGVLSALDLMYWLARANGDLVQSHEHT